MHFESIEINGQPAVRVAERGVVVTSAQDALTLVAESGCGRIVLRREQLHPDFYELRTGLAGEVMQKIVTYGCRLAVVGDFGEVHSRSFRALMHESNRTGHIVFAGSEEELAGLWR